VNRKGQAGALIAVLVAAIIGVAVTIPVVIDVVAATNFTGYTTTETVVKLLPLMVGVLLLVGTVSYMKFST